MMRTYGGLRPEFVKLSDIYPMSRDPSSELYDLIQALTQTEKRYVKQELKRHVLGDVNQSELLFDAVAGQERYNEASIKKRFAGHGFVRRLPEAKRELVLVILRAMRQYHAERTPMRRAISGFADGEFLRSRGLFKWAERKFTEAARESELVHHHQLHALALDGLVGLQRSQEKFPEPTTPIEEDEAYVEAIAMQEVAIYEGLSDRMQAVVARYGTSQNPAGIALANDLVAKGERHLPITTLAAQNHWLRALSLKAFFIDNDVATALAYDRSRLEVVERDERYRKANFNAWINLVHSTALRTVMSGDVNGARPLRDKLRNFWLFESKAISPRNRRATLGNYLNLDLLISIYELPTSTNEPPVKMLRELLDEHESTNRSELGMICRLNLGLLLFGIEKYRESIRQLNIVDDYPEELRDDAHRASRYIRILCHIEQQHETVVTSLIRKERRLLKGASIPADEELFLNMAGRYLLQTPGKQRTALLKSTLDTLTALAPDERTSITGMFAFNAWLKAKLTNRPWRTFLAD
jgi:hypothetical protein